MKKISKLEALRLTKKALAEKLNEIDERIAQEEILEMEARSGPPVKCQPYDEREIGIGAFA